MKHQILFEILGKMQEYFGKELRPEIQKMYFDGLNNLTDEDLQTAAVRIIQEFQPTSAKPFPLIADFLSFCGKDGKTEAVNVVTRVKTMALKVGQYESVNFEDRALHCVIERYGGWPEIVLWGEKDWQLRERNFIEAYRAAKAAGLYGPAKVAGLTEIDNWRENQQIEEKHKQKTLAEANGDRGMWQDNERVGVNIPQIKF